MASRKGGRLFDIGELGGLLKTVAWRAGIDVLLVPPTNLKQFATSSGRADKDKGRVAQGILNSWGVRLERDDEADAFVLLKMGEAYLGGPRACRKGFRKSALAGCSLQKGAAVAHDFNVARCADRIDRRR